MTTQQAAYKFALARIEEIELETDVTPLRRSVLRLGLTCVTNDYKKLNMKLPTALALRFEDAVEKVKLLTGGEGR